MLGAIYTHYTLHDRLDRMAPGIIFGLLLFTRLIIHQQVKRASSNVKSETSTTLKTEEKLIEQKPVDEKPKSKKKANEKKKN